ALWENYLDSLRPRWGGSLEKMVQFAIECVDTGRFDTAIPYLGVLCLLEVEKEIGMDKYWNRKEVVDAMDRLARGLAAEEIRSNEPDAWYPLLRAALMWKGKYYGRAAAALKEAGPLDDPGLGLAQNAFGRVGGVATDAIGEIKVRTSPLSGGYRSAMEHLEKNRFGQAKAQLNKLINQNKDKLTPRAEAFLKLKRDEVNFRQRLKSGQWIELSGKNKTLNAWEQAQGQWHIDDQGRIVGKADANGLSLIHKHLAYPRWELTCDVEILSEKQQPWANAGIGFVKFNKTKSTGCVLYPERSKFLGQFVSMFSGRPADVDTKAQTNKITIRHEPIGLMLFLLNDQAPKMAFARSPGNKTRIRIQLYSANKNIDHMKPGEAHMADSALTGLIVRYSNVRIRGLSGK
ncbi:MAG: hypothetical protein AAF085_04510, partial [Planctomycetota bacterium]